MHPKILRNKHFLPSDTERPVSISGGSKCSFFGAFGVHRGHVTSVLKFPPLPYYRRIEEYKFSPSAFLCRFRPLNFVIYELKNCSTKIQKIALT